MIGGGSWCLTSIHWGAHGPQCFEGSPPPTWLLSAWPWLRVVPGREWNGSFASKVTIIKWTCLILTLSVIVGLKNNLKLQANVLEILCSTNFWFPQVPYWRAQKIYLNKLKSREAVNHIHIHLWLGCEGLPRETQGKQSEFVTTFSEEWFVFKLVGSIVFCGFGDGLAHDLLVLSGLGF